MTVVSATLSDIASHTWQLLLDAAPWLVFGLMAAGLARAWLPVDGLGRWLGGRGLRPAVLAALIGAPLPLCSCAVLPAAVELRRGGASREAVAAFLIATPETGLDSVALSYGLLGPFFAIARPIAAVGGAIATGMAMTLLPPDAPAEAVVATGCCSNTSCCAGKGAAPAGAARRTLDGLAFAFSTLFDELAPWLAAGLIAAGITATLMPPEKLGSLGSGLPAMLAMIAIGIPMYICATASTPLAAALLLAGVSPGAVMVFLLVGPATNLAAIAVVRRELGNTASAVYLGGLIVSGLLAGLLTDLVAPLFFDPVAFHAGAIVESGSEWPGVVATCLLLGLSGRSIWRRARGQFEKFSVP